VDCAHGFHRLALCAAQTVFSGCEGQGSVASLVGGMVLLGMAETEKSGREKPTARFWRRDAMEDGLMRLGSGPEAERH
jgi:hypothetical protein